MNNFRYAITLAKLIHDAEVKDEEDAIEIGLVAYNFIGNKNTRLYRTTLDVNCDDGTVELPCNLSLIESVTYCGPEDWKHTSNTKEFGDRTSLYSENYIEGQKIFKDPLYMSGKFVNYKKVGNKLIIQGGWSKVNILYHGILADEDGLPEITDKEAVAIADYIAYTQKYKEAIRTNNQLVFRMAQEIKQQWLQHCDAARVPEYISQDEMNKILDANSSWNRKSYGYSYKPTL